MKNTRLLLLVLGTVLVASVVLVSLDLGVMSVLATISLVVSLLALLLWGAWRLYNAFLWKVGRRLAFSYFLVGVLPIPLVLMVLAAVVYIQSGFILGHLYHDAVEAAKRTHARIILRNSTWHGGGSRSNDRPSGVEAHGSRSSLPSGVPSALPN